MNKKDNILESWIMVEHLSEGDINLKDKSIITLNEIKDNNFYDLLLSEIQKKKMKNNQYDENNKPTNVGTVHTFQGKEAPIVFLVLGADEKCTGAAKWAMGTENPNIMNVAATRAKEQFYIIGDKKLYLNLESNVINNTYEIIERFEPNA